MAKKRPAKKKPAPARKRAAARRKAAPRAGATAAVRRTRPALQAERRRADPQSLRLRAIEPTFTVDDLERSVRFYTEALGFFVADRWTADGMLKGVMLKAGVCSIGLSQDDWSKGRDRQKGVGFSLWCSTAQDVDALAARIKSAGGGLVEDRAPRADQVVVESLAEERMREAPAGRVVDRLDDGSAGRRLDERAGIELRHPGDSGERSDRELAAEHRRRLEQTARIVVKQRQPGPHQLSDALRRPGRGAVELQELAQEQRVSLGLAVELVDPGGVLIAAGRLRQVRGHLGAIQPVERQLFPGLARDARQERPDLGRQPRLDIAIGPEHHERTGAQVARDEVEELERGEVGGVQIVEHEEAREPAAASRKAPTAANSWKRSIGASDGVTSRSSVARSPGTVPSAWMNGQ